MDKNEKSLVGYEIKVTSEGGEESFTFDNLMNREADTGFVILFAINCAASSSAEPPISPIIMMA